MVVASAVQRKDIAFAIITDEPRAGSQVKCLNTILTAVQSIHVVISDLRPLCLTK